MTKTAKVPCNGCIECCKGPNHELIIPDYEWVNYSIVIGRDGFARIQNDPDTGHCIYLGDEGCTIYDTRPSVCREFDCRRHINNPALPNRIRLAAIAILKRERGY